MTILYSRTVHHESPEGHPGLSYSYALHEFDAAGFALVKTTYLDGQRQEEECVWWRNGEYCLRAEAIEHAVAVVTKARDDAGKRAAA